MRDCHALFKSMTVPLSWLRALSFVVLLLGSAPVP